MDIQKVDAYLAANAKFFKPEHIPTVRGKLISLPDTSYPILISLNLNDPTTTIIISIFFGYLGIDRFMLGDIGMGILKLLTVGCCGILTIIDWCTCMDRAKDKNLEKIMTIM